MLRRQPPTASTASRTTFAEHSSEKISLQDIADLEHITTYHASHFITKILGISFQDYLNNVRFEHALELIQNSDLSILDICMETGFSSSRYLNKLFEEKMGCTAREYLKTSKKPHLIDTVLPTDNIQKRYSFEQSAFYSAEGSGLVCFVFYLKAVLSDLATTRLSPALLSML